MIGRDDVTNSTKPVLVIFAKAPVAGQVKTRLIPSLGAQGAADLHYRLLDHTLSWAAALDHATVELWSPDTKHRAMHTYGKPVYQQMGLDLGQRMANAFERVLDRAPAALIVGTDCPTLNAEIVTDAFALLSDSADVVLGPAEDGGYYLIGMRESTPSLFNEIEWGGEQVFADTVMKLDRSESIWRELPRLWDVDRPEDVDRLLAEFPSL